MAWYDEFWDGFKKPFEFVYHRGERLLGFGDRLLDAAGNVATGLGGVAGGIGDLFSGNSNMLIYLGIGVVVVVALPTILNKVL